MVWELDEDVMIMEGGTKDLGEAATMVVTAGMIETEVVETETETEVGVTEVATEGMIEEEIETETEVDATEAVTVVTAPETETVTAADVSAADLAPGLPHATAVKLRELVQGERVAW